MIAPLALIGLLALPVIVAFYMLRLRRRDVPVGSTFLWQQLVRDVEANAPWQRLRFSWLLLVQLLIAAIVVLAAARPFTATISDLGGNVVLVVDTSASMATLTDDEDRMALARERAAEVIDRLPEDGRVTVVAAADTAEVLVSETDDRDTALDAVATLQATQLPGDLTDAFALASALAARDSDSTVVVVTDASGDTLPDVGVGAPVVVERVGATDANQAIAALSALRRSGGAQLDLFVAVSNPSSTDATRRLEILADGALVDARELVVPAGQRSEVLIATVPSATRTIEARLAGADALAADDRAFAIVPPEAITRALLVGPENPYLEHALALLPRLELYAVGEDGFADAMAEADEAGTPYGLLVFDGFVPDEPVTVPALYVDPPADGTFGTVDGRAESPLIDRVDPDEPLLRFVDLSTVHIGRARQIELADRMRAVVSSTDGDPLVGAGEPVGVRTALIGFALDESDLPLQIAFPLLTSNLVEYLLPTAGGLLPSSMPLGSSAALSVDPALERVRVSDAGTVTSELDLRVIGGRVTLPGASQVGIRSLRALDADGPGDELGRTAINLFSADESDVSPGDPQRIVEMGRVVDGPSGDGRPARAEWWWPLALAALGLLALEWLLFHRPTRRTLRRALARRPSLGARVP